MSDTAKRIGSGAFYGCRALKFIPLSKVLEHIGAGAFYGCSSLEALFLPSTITSIESGAFKLCRSLRLLILPSLRNGGNVGKAIIYGAGIYQISETARVRYVKDDHNVTDYSSRRVNEWLHHHMDETPFHKLCYDPSITTKQISDYLVVDNRSNHSALQTDPYYDMTPLHILSMNPHGPADAIASLFHSNMQAIFHEDNQQKTPLEYSRYYNVGGLIGMITVLCNHRNSQSCQISHNPQHIAKKPRIV